MTKFRVLSLFAGIGGFDIGLERSGGFETVAFCEIDPYCQAVLRKHWPGIPCYDDVRTLTADRLRADGIIPDVICGGFPCQDISFAGNGAGLAGERSGLWSEYARIISEVRPKYVILENVAAILGRGLQRVLSDLASIRYDAEWHVISAFHVGLPHIRDRLWLVAYSSQERPSESLESIQTPCLSRELGRMVRSNRVFRMDHPPVCGMDDGLRPELDGHQALGNAVVPQIPELIGRAIMQAEGLTP